MKYSPISLKYDNKFIVVNAMDILYFIASQNHTEIFFKNGKVITSLLPLKTIKKRINSKFFFTINNKTLINVKEVDLFIQKGSSWFAIMEDQREINVESARIKIFKKKYLVV